MKSLIKFTAALLCAVLLAGCSASMKDYSSSDGYSVSVPKSWQTFNTAGGFHSYVSNKDTSSVKISVTSAGEYTAVSDWWNANLDKLTATFDELGEITASNVIIDGAAAIRAEFTAALSFDSSEETGDSDESETESKSDAESAVESTKYKYCFIQVHIYKNGNIYSIICSATEDNYEERVSDFESIISSFKFTDAFSEESEPNTDGAPAGMQNAALKNTDYSICVPLDWTLTHGDGYVEAHTKSDGTAVSVYSWDLDSNITLDEWWDMYLSEISPIAKKLSVITDEKLTLDGKDASHKIFTATVAGENYKFSQYAVIYDYVLRVVTFTSSDDTFDSHADEFAQIISTFKFDK